MATGGDDGVLRVISATASPAVPAAPPVLLLPHGGPVTAVAVSPSPGLLATGCTDGVVRLIAFSGFNRSRVVLAVHCAELVDGGNGGCGPVRCLSYSAAGDLAVGLDSGTVVVVSARMLSVKEDEED